MKIRLVIVGRALHNLLLNIILIIGNIFAKHKINKYVYKTNYSINPRPCGFTPT
jgi:hypothetical protein